VLLQEQKESDVKSSRANEDQQPEGDYGGDHIIDTANKSMNKINKVLNKVASLHVQEAYSKRSLSQRVKNMRALVMKKHQRVSGFTEF
jgi:hypothetical protein